MVDAKGSGNLLYLPLDKLMQQAGAAAVEAAAPRQGDVLTLPPLSGDAAAADMRSRDALRARERGER
jgi:membrane protease subunit HflK